MDGIFNKREEFKYLLDKEKPSLVLLVETKLNVDIANMEIFDVNDYEVGYIAETGWNRMLQVVG